MGIVLRWMMGHITDLCESTNKQRFTCNGAKVMYNASLIWGTIGPQRMFQSGQVYNGLVYFFLIGVSSQPTWFDLALLTLQPVVTVLVYLTYRRYPNSWVRYINVPIFFNAAGNIPPANTSMSAETSMMELFESNRTAQYSLWFIVGFVFNYLIRKRAFDWWKRYNCEFLPSQDSSIEIKSLINDVCRFAPSSYGYRHCHRDNHHFLRAGLPRYYFQLVGKHSGIQHGGFAFRPLVDCSQRKLFRKRPWRVLSEVSYHWIHSELWDMLDAGNWSTTLKNLKNHRTKHACLVYSEFFQNSCFPLL